MPKEGILHDYDLKANEESSAQNQTCVVCGASPVRYQWSDYSGEGMCTQCGCPYQLKWGSDEQKWEKILVANEFDPTEDYPRDWEQ